MGRTRRGGWAVRVAPVAALIAAACGSRGPIDDDPFRSRDAALRDAASTDAASTDAASTDAASTDATEVPCRWEDFSSNLTGAGIAVIERDDRVVGAEVLYAASGALIYRSGDGGRSWDPRGASPAAARAIAFPDEPTELLIGTTDGVWVSHDEGLTFEPRSLRGLDVSELEAHPASRDRIFAAVSSLGVIRSNDSGASWAPASDGLTPDSSVLRISPDPRDDRDAVAGTYLDDPTAIGAPNAGQLMRTDDGGGRWVELDREGGRVFEVRRCAARPEVLFAARYRGLFRSTDGGLSFAPLAALGDATTVAVDVAGSSCERVIAFVSAPEFGVRVSSDGGESFEGPFIDGLGVTRLSRSGPIFRLVDDGVLAGAVTGIFASPDGRIWNAIGGLVEVGVGALAASEGHLWAGTGGAGAWVLERDASVWTRIPTTELENDYVFSLFPRGGASASAGDVLIGSYGFLYGRAGMGAFSRVPTDGVDADNVFDFVELDDGVILTASQTEGVQRSDDGGASFRFSRDGFGGWMTPIGFVTDLRALAAGPMGSGTVVAGTSGRGLWRSIDRGLSWTPSELVEGESLMVERWEAHGTYLASISGSGLRVSRDGVRWETANEGLASLDIGGIAIDGEDAIVTAGGRVYGSRSPAARWEPLDDVCAPAGARRAVIVTRPDGRWVFVASGPHGVARHRLE